MNFKHITATIACAVALGSFGSTAFAAADDHMNFPDLMKMEMIDTNKDGMVSKAEFLAVMGKAWDMKAKDMKVKGDKMTADEFKELGRFLSRGEKN